MAAEDPALGRRSPLRWRLDEEPSNSDVFLTENAAFIGLISQAVERLTGKLPALSTGGGTSGWLEPRCINATNGFRSLISDRVTEIYSHILEARPSFAPAVAGSASGGRVGCGAVALGRTYLLPPLSVDGALLSRPWLPFPHPPHRTGRADLPLGQELTPSPTTRPVQVGSDVPARSARKDASLDMPRPCVVWSCAWSVATGATALRCSCRVHDTPY